MKGKLLGLIILFSLLGVLIGKAWFNRDAPNLFLYIYGILLTLFGFVTFTITYLRYKDPYFEAQKIPASKKKEYFVSCLVAVRNEEKIIKQCVESLINQTYEKREIIFVDDASTDRTKEILDKYARKGLIQVIHISENVGKKKALAQGMLRAKGDIFAFSDSDSVLANDAIEKVVDVFNLDPLIGGVSGHCRALNGGRNILTKIQDSWYEGQFSIRKAFESVYGSVTCVSGPLAVFRREAIYNYIPAWENDKFLGSEFKFATDRTLTGFVLGSKYVGEKLKKKYSSSPFVKEINYPTRDWKIVYCKSARVWTEVPFTIKQFLRQQIRWKKSFIRNIFFTGKFYWRKPFVPAAAYYGHIMFVLLGPFIVARHLIYLPLKGNIFSAVLYLSGIFFVGLMYALAYKMENKDDDKWVYRPLMSLISTLVLSWLLFYSLYTIRNSKWTRHEIEKRRRT